MFKIEDKYHFFESERAGSFVANRTVKAILIENTRNFLVNCCKTQTQTVNS